MPIENSEAVTTAPLGSVSTAPACNYCSTPITGGDTITETAEGDMVCDLCFRNRTQVCQDCEDVYAEDSSDIRSIMGGDRIVCDNCLDNYRYCDRCDDYVAEDDYCGDGLCNSCDEQRDDQQDEDTYRSPQKHTITANGDEDARGQYVDHLQTFGLELECLVEDRDTLLQVSQDLPRSCGLTSDGSINGRGCGIEIVTPPLKGLAGEEYLKSILSTLDQHGAYVNRTCGLHLHIGVDRDNWLFLRNLLAFYVVFDDIILSMLPPSRRGNNYCHAVKGKVSLNDLKKINDPQGLDEAWYKMRVMSDEDRDRLIAIKGNKYHDTRYLGLNLHSAFYRGTAEIRYHSGTLNLKKILNWVALHQCIFTAVKELGQNYGLLWQVLEKSFMVVNQEKKREDMLKIIKAPASLLSYIESRTRELNNQ